MILGSCGPCQSGANRLTLNYSEYMSATDALDQERLCSEDIEFLRTLRRTFESMSVGNCSSVQGKMVSTYSELADDNVFLRDRTGNGYKKN